MVARGQGRSLAKINHKLLGLSGGRVDLQEKSQYVSQNYIYAEGPATSIFFWGGKGKRRNIVVSLGTLTTNLLPSSFPGVMCFGTICLHFPHFPLLLVGTARVYVVQICLLGLLPPFLRGKVFEPIEKRLNRWISFSENQYRVFFPYVFVKNGRRSV